MAYISGSRSVRSFLPNIILIGGGNDGLSINKEKKTMGYPSYLNSCPPRNNSVWEWGGIWGMANGGVRVSHGVWRMAYGVWCVEYWWHMVYRVRRMPDLRNKLKWKKFVSKHPRLRRSCFFLFFFNHKRGHSWMHQTSPLKSAWDGRPVKLNKINIWLLIHQRNCLWNA